MSISRSKCVATALFAALVLASAANAQRRVFTNEDVSTTPPPASAPAAESATPAAPPGATSRESAPAAAPGTPVADLNRAHALQGTLMDLFGEFTAKANEAADSAIQKRWTDMSVCVSALMQANQRNIEELEERVPPEQRPRPMDGSGPPDQPENQ
ncbi:MAG: hypothetical protein HY316_06755 [Acidobacteria bacterium]|nr:hypothetical protein [Acidobacteriota bacterium]